MPVRKNIESDFDLTVVTFVGKVTFEEMMQVVREIWESEPMTRNVLWRGEAGASISHFSREQLAEAATLVAKYPELLPMRAGGRSAIVAPEDVDYGLSRMIQAMHTAAGPTLTYDIRVFRSESEARRWIAG
jgi:hypothetical protein